MYTYTSWIRKGLIHTRFSLHLLILFLPPPRVFRQTAVVGTLKLYKKKKKSFRYTPNDVITFLHDGTRSVTRGSFFPRLRLSRSLFGGKRSTVSSERAVPQTPFVTLFSPGENSPKNTQLQRQPPLRDSRKNPYGRSERGRQHDDCSA